MTDSEILDDVIRREGGFVNHPADRGGATKYGITSDTLSQYRGQKVTDADVFELTMDEARAIYQKLFIDDPGLGAVDDLRLRSLLVDSAVNHGPARAVKFLQRALGVKDDGVFGEKTLAALKAADASALYRKVLGERIKFYGRIIAADPSQAVFAAGWMNRVVEFIG